MRLLTDPYPPSRGSNLRGRRALPGPAVAHVALLVSHRREGHRSGVTGNSPSSCLRHVRGDGLSLQFFCGEKKTPVLPDWHLLCPKAASSAVQELSCDEGNVPRDAGGERSGQPKHGRCVAPLRWGDEPGAGQ